ncbi:hypothetical protein KKD20_05590 [Patescibacteria group bacterium]|nr:hypothetical protein [Patescibacteria group bacterium]
MNSKKWRMFVVQEKEVGGLAVAVSCRVGDEMVEQFESSSQYVVHQTGSKDLNWVYLLEAVEEKDGELAFSIPDELAEDVRMGLSLRIGQDSQGLVFERVWRLSERKPFEIRVASDGKGYVNNLRVFPDSEDEEAQEKEFEPILLRHWSRDTFRLEVRREGRKVIITLV